MMRPTCLRITNARLRFIFTAFTGLFLLTYSAINSYINIVERHCVTCDSKTFTNVARPENGSHTLQEHRIVNPERVEYIMTPPDVCKNSSNLLLILVKSDASNVALRMAIRQTWGNISHPKIKIIYLLGYYSIIHETIENEALTHEDILQGDFVDIYDHNINKTTMAYQWAVQNCKNTQYLLFVDDDFFVNTYNVYKYLSSLPDHMKSHLYTGYIIKDLKPFRTKSSRWYISIEEFPDEIFPPFLIGGAYLLSMSIAKQLKNAFPYVRYIHIDDCYIGIVSKALNLKMTDDKRRFDAKHTTPMHLKDVFASHGYKDHRQLLVVWKIFLETVSKTALSSFYKTLK